VGRYRRRLIALALVLVLLGAYAAAGFLAVPHFARSAAVDFVRSHYGRTLAIGAIGFNPFNLNLDVTQVSLPDADGQPMLAFGRLHVALSPATLWHFAPSFAEIRLEQPYVRVVMRPNGGVNLADLGKGFPPAPPQPPPPKKPAPLRLYITHLAVIDGSSSFEDRSRPTPFRADLKPIAFELRDFSTTAATGNDYALEASSTRGERLTWSGSLRLEPFASTGRFEIAELQARTVWSYLQALLPFEIDSGSIGVKGGYDFALAAGSPALSLDVSSVTVTRLGLKPRGGSDDYLMLDRIEIDGTRVDLPHRRVDVARVHLAGGDIKAWLSEQGRLNLLDLAGPAGASAPARTSPPAEHSAPGASGAEGGGTAIPPPQTPDASPTAGTPAAPTWTVSAPDIALDGLAVTAEDRQLRPAAVLLLKPLALKLTGFDTSPDDVLGVSFDSTVNESGRIRVTGKLSPRTVSGSAHLEAEHLDLRALQPLIAQYTAMTLLKGELGARADAERRADGSFEVKGAARVRDLRTVDDALRNDFVRWRDLAIADASYSSQPARLRIGSVTLVDPYARVIIAPDQTLNIKQVLAPHGVAPHPSAAAPPPHAAAAAPAPPGAADPAPLRRGGRARGAPPPPAPPGKPLTPFPVSIGAVRVVNGAANYTDLWIKPSFSVSMQSLNGAVTGLSSDPVSRAKVQLNGKVEQYSPVTIAGDVNLLSAALYTDIRMGFKDIDLTIVNPYSGHFVGYKIDKGKLSVDVSYHIEQRRLTAAQHFVVDQLELGERVESPDAVHLPLKLAVALLKDRNGVIDVNLPMSGSIDDPTFRIGPIIWKMVVNLIVKAATAPFALLAHLVGGGGEHMNIVEFAAGSAALDQPTQDQLASLAQALAERPQLKLDVPIVSSARLDRPQLARARLDRELEARAQATRQGRRHPQEAAELALADPATHLKLLTEQYRADLGKDAPLPASVLAVQEAGKKPPPPLDPAIADLETALVARIDIPDSDLDALGKARAQAIQGALLAAGTVDAARVFIVNAAPKPDSGDRVRVELSLK
jgi:hypothetical protein